MFKSLKLRFAFFLALGALLSFSSKAQNIDFSRYLRARIEAGSKPAAKKATTPIQAPIQRETIQHEATNAPEKPRSTGKAQEPLMEVFSEISAEAFTCTEQYSVYWALARELIKKPAPEGVDLEEHFTALEKSLEKHVLANAPQSEWKEKTIYALKRLYYLAFFVSKRHYSQKSSDTLEDYAEQLHSNASHLNSDQGDFRRELQKAISALSYYATVFPEDCKRNPAEENLSTRINSANGEALAVVAEKPQNTPETPPNSSARQHLLESIAEILTPPRLPSSGSQAPQPTTPESKPEPQPKPTPVEPAPEKLDPAPPARELLAPPAIITPPAPQRPPVVTTPPVAPTKPNPPPKPQPTHQTPPVRPTPPKPTPPVSPPAPPAQTPPPSSKVDLLDIIAQDEDCLVRLPLNTRRLAFTQFLSNVKAKKGKVDESLINVFAARAAYTLTESSGGWTVASMAESDWSHTPYDRMIKASSLDWTKPENKRFSSRRVSFTDPNTGVKKTVTSPYGPLASLSTYRDVLIAGSKTQAIRDAEDAYEIAKTQGSAAREAAKKRLKDAKKAKDPFYIDWIDSTNFGITQMSADRLIMTKERAALITDHNWLKSQVQNNNFAVVHNYCRSGDFFKDSSSAIEAEFKKIQSCRMYDSSNPKRKVVTKEYRDCFAAWMMLCPGLNFHVSTYAPPEYFAKKTRAQKPVCTSSFRDILKKYNAGQL